ncbi:codanin-1 [Daktulosphaira vitifoliae]|uniref:codanin-1 n=1 Tax=Daktulosphaira vitifoliae TaxID=58002 RepID=UPI0021AA290C|nr:codanin-1 [Daktulosphaira vitifoliae]XP_050528823.1 codanin-1 [Daktulosphaira vitifoliae]
MHKSMSKSEVRCASLLNNVLDENININEILEKIKSTEQINVRPGVGKIEFTIYLIDFIHNKTMPLLNPPDDNTLTSNNIFNVPEVDSPTDIRMFPKTSTPKKNNSKHDKKTVQIHTITLKATKVKMLDVSIKNQKCLDLLAYLYSAILESDLLCNLYHELEFVFTVLTFSNLEKKTSFENLDSSTIMYFKSIEDCQYFASKTIQNLSSTISYLEKPLVNVIVKLKVINTYVPELSKILESNLNSTIVNDDVKSLNSSISKSMVKFDEEHDTKDCFPTLKMFHAFKTQRDAFYELLESWKQTDNQIQLNPNKVTHIHKMLSEHNSTVNMSKFTRLFVTQLINSSFEESKNVYKSKTLQDLSASKLELLHQRITKRDYTSGSNINPSNEFTGVQLFFREFVTLSLVNGIFCKHLIDTLVHRIDVINSMEWASELQEGGIYHQTFFTYLDTLRLLAKFLAFTLYYPYKDCNMINPALKEYLWDVRSKVTPPLNILSKLRDAVKRGNGQIILTVFWVIEYLYQVDKISITTQFYKSVLTWLYSFCLNVPPITASALMLKLQINSLFEYINVVPHTLLDEVNKTRDKCVVENIRSALKNGPIVNTKQLYHYCPQLNNFRAILENKNNNKKQKFVSPTLRSTNRKDIKQKHLIELELESHFFENHSPSVLTTVDFVAKRMASSCTKKIQSKGVAAVKNHFVNTVCEKLKSYLSGDIEADFKIDENDVTKTSMFLNTLIQKYIDDFAKNNIPISLKQLLDSNILNPHSLSFCTAVAVRKLKILVSEWVKNHINIKNILIDYISTELKHNLKVGDINQDGSNLYEILLPNQTIDIDKDMFIPENELLVDLNIFSLKIIEAEGYQLTSEDLSNYSEKFKIIIENKKNIDPAVFRFIITRLIDNVLLATYHSPKLINTDVIKAYHQYFNEKLFEVSLILCERNINLLSHKSNSVKALIADKITEWIKYFIENSYLTIDDLTNQIMSILRISWPEDTLKCLSVCFKDLNSVCLKNFDDSKVQELFLWLTHFIDVIEDYNEQL